MSEAALSPGEAFRVKTSGTCSKCGRETEGWIAFSDSSQVVDSGGFMVFADGLTCDECLGESGLGKNPPDVGVAAFPSSLRMVWTGGYSVPPIPPRDRALSPFQ